MHSRFSIELAPARFEQFLRTWASNYYDRKQAVARTQSRIGHTSVATFLLILTR